MRRATILMAVVTLASLVSTSQAGIFGWRLVRCHAQRPAYSQTRSDQDRDVKVAVAINTAEQKAAAPAVHASVSQTSTTRQQVGRHRSLDERRVAELGPSRARMVYSTYDDTDPYPVCKAWTWDDEEGWHWEWSELNCPWKELREAPEFYSD